MIHRRRGGRGLAAAVIFGVATFLSTGVEAKRVHPFRSALVVRWGGEAGSEAFRADLTRSIADSLAARCFSGVEIVDRDPSRTSADLVFVVVLSGVVDEIRFEDSIATALQSDEPSNALRRVARFTVTVDAVLSARSSGSIVRREHFVTNVSRRPIVAGEDAQATARIEAIERTAVDLVGAFRCGSEKLDRRIRDAVRDDPAASAGPR
jgi:hypothetical protein